MFIFYKFRVIWLPLRCHQDSRSVVFYWNSPCLLDKESMIDVTDEEKEWYRGQNGIVADSVLYFKFLRYFVGRSSRLTNALTAQILLGEEVHIRMLRNFVILSIREQTSPDVHPYWQKSKELIDSPPHFHLHPHLVTSFWGGNDNLTYDRGGAPVPFNVLGRIL